MNESLAQQSQSLTGVSGNWQYMQKYIYLIHMSLLYCTLHITICFTYGFGVIAFPCIVIKRKVLVEMRLGGDVVSCTWDYSVLSSLLSMNDFTFSDESMLPCSSVLPHMSCFLVRDCILSISYGKCVLGLATGDSPQ